MLEHDPEPPSAVSPDVPDVVDAVLLKALRKDPMERYGNVSQLGQALENAAAAASIQSRNRRVMPSSSPALSSYRVVPDDVARATTDPSPGYLNELRAREEAEQSSSRAPARPSTRPTPLDPHERARQLASLTRAAMASGSLDEAVERAEQLFDHALANSRDPIVLEVLRTHLALLERIFAQRLGDLERTVAVAPASAAPLDLAPAAVALIQAAASGATLRQILDRAAIPRRDAIRVLAGLLRRGVLDAG